MIERGKREHKKILDLPIYKSQTSEPAALKRQQLPPFATKEIYTATQTAIRKALQLDYKTPVVARKPRKHQPSSQQRATDSSPVVALCPMGLGASTP